MAEVTIRSLRKSYDDTEVIHGLDIDIVDGEFVVLVGPSGCGKSTLLRMIAGLESVTGGKISIGDRVVNNLPPAERDIAMVFQNYALYPHKTVGANIGFSLKMKGMDKAEIKQRVALRANAIVNNPPGGCDARSGSTGVVDAFIFFDRLLFVHRRFAKCSVDIFDRSIDCFISKTAKLSKQVSGQRLFFYGALLNGGHERARIGGP
jgi:ABC-type uncharacterized transport system YnjBCD ATPase subunit